MLLYVYDKTITLCGIVEEITSLVWNDKKYTYGTFSMLLPATATNIAILAESRLIVRDDDPDKIAGEILYIRLSKSTNGSEVLEVTGKLLNFWLNDRVITSGNGCFSSTTLKPLQIMRTAVNENCIETSVNRKYPLLSLGYMLEDRTQYILDFVSGQYVTVLTMLAELAEGYDLGYNIAIDIANKTYNFNTYTGKDHTTTSNSPCIFSVEFDNILEQEYTGSIEDVKNMAYIAGDPESRQGATLLEVGSNTTGFERKEMFVNASSIKDDTEQLTLAEYQEALRTAGKIGLQERRKLTSFYSKINTASNSFIYGLDYKLGDKVTCINTAWGLQIDVVITEAQTTYEDGQKEVRLTFGASLPTLYDKLKQFRR